MQLDMARFAGIPGGARAEASGRAEGKIFGTTSAKALGKIFGTTSAQASEKAEGASFCESGHERGSDLNDAMPGQQCIIKDIVTDDEDMRKFLFSLGCYSGETVTLVSRKGSNLVLAIKDARYNIDSDLASAIII